MEERQVTVDGDVPTRCPRPSSSSRPRTRSDQLGTYPLPESQLDRFLMCIDARLPGPGQSERALLAGPGPAASLLEPAWQPVMTPARAAGGAAAPCRAVHGARDPLLDYLQALLDATRSGQWFVEGLSPRAGLAWLRAARAKALLAGRSHVSPEDLQAVAVQVLAHRLRARSGSGRGAAEQVRALVEAVALP
jgi:MoxR-like ATPase